MGKDTMTEANTTRRPATLGWVALVTSFIAITLFILTASHGFPTPASRNTVRIIIMWGAPVLVIALSVAAFVRGERRTPSVLALIITAGSPLIVIGVVAAVFWGYQPGQG